MVFIKMDYRHYVEKKEFNFIIIVEMSGYNCIGINIDVEWFRDYFNQ